MKKTLRDFDDIILKLQHFISSFLSLKMLLFEKLFQTSGIKKKSYREKNFKWNSLSEWIEE